VYRKSGYCNFDHPYNVSYSLACALGCGEFYEGGPRVCRQPVTWSATAESLRNTDLKRAKCILIQQRSSGIVTAVEMYVNESGVL
jgi:hypothetical protein